MRQVDIKGFEDYQITDDGRVWSKKTNKWMKPSIEKTGYKHVVLNGRYNKRIHRLVAEAFVPNPEDKPCVDHIIPISDGGTNEASNLRWVTQEENCNNIISKINYSKAKSGIILSEEAKKKMSDSHKGKPSKNKKIVYQYSLDGEFLKEWKSISECDNNGFNKSLISLCCNGKNKTAYGFIWRYKNDQPN